MIKVDNGHAIVASPLGRTRSDQTDSMPHRSCREIGRSKCGMSGVLLLVLDNAQCRVKRSNTVITGSALF